MLIFSLLATSDKCDLVAFSMSLHFRYQLQLQQAPDDGESSLRSTSGFQTVK